MTDFSIHIETGSALRAKRLRMKRFQRVFGEMRKQIGDEKDAIELLLTNHREMQKFNFKFRKKNKPTDVLSFPSDRRPLMGSIIIDLETAENQARDFSHSFEQECLELFIHGVLHLYGFDHEIAPEADFMSFYESYFVGLSKKM